LTFDLALLKSSGGADILVCLGRMSGAILGPANPPSQLDNQRISAERFDLWLLSRALPHPTFIRVHSRIASSSHFSRASIAQAFTNPRPITTPVTLQGVF
jgi:hypothetical protein